MGQIEDLQTKGFGSHGGLVNVYHGEIEPLGKRVLVEVCNLVKLKLKVDLF